MKTTFLTAIVFVIVILTSAQSCRKDHEGMKSSKDAKNPMLSLRTTEDSLLQVKIFNFISRMNIVREDRIMKAVKHGIILKIVPFGILKLQ